MKCCESLHEKPHIIVLDATYWRKNDIKLIINSVFLAILAEISYVSAGQAAAKKFCMQYPNERGRCFCRAASGWQQRG
jgi:hypothetical protein